MKKNILICGGGGFIGHHLARRLKDQNNYIIVADIKTIEEASLYQSAVSYCHFYASLDLGVDMSWATIDNYLTDNNIQLDEIYQLAADMGGAGYIFTGNNDSTLMTNSALINLHAVQFALKWHAKIFYSSSACMYPSYNQQDPLNPKCSEDSAYPALPDSEYGWEKLFSERLYLAYSRNHGLNAKIARFHNIYGPEGCWNNGREKAPAAICRKVAELTLVSGTVEVWGPGNQTRSFLYIEDCLDAIQLLMESDYKQPINIGSEEMISINNLVKLAASIANKPVEIKNVPGPIGVMGRNSDNTLIRQVLGWEPKYDLEKGITKLYNWILGQTNTSKTLDA